VSEPIIEEFRRVITKGFYFSEKKAKVYTNHMLEISYLIQPEITVDKISVDPPDNRILECALSGNARFIISGDKKHLLKLGNYRDIRIVSPAHFLKEIED